MKINTFPYSSISIMRENNSAKYVALNSWYRAYALGLLSQGLETADGNTLKRIERHMIRISKNFARINK